LGEGYVDSVEACGGGALDVGAEVEVGVDGLVYLLELEPRLAFGPFFGECYGQVECAVGVLGLLDEVEVSPDQGVGGGGERALGEVFELFDLLGVGGAVAVEVEQKDGGEVELVVFSGEMACNEVAFERLLEVDLVEAVVVGDAGANHDEDTCRVGFKVGIDEGVVGVARLQGAGVLGGEVGLLEENDVVEVDEVVYILGD
jgi:hypothetical protein